MRLERENLRGLFIVEQGEVGAFKAGDRISCLVGHYDIKLDAARCVVRRGSGTLGEGGHLGSRRLLSGNCPLLRKQTGRDANDKCETGATQSVHGAILRENPLCELAGSLF
jgi:hypothetical protein